MGPLAALTIGVGTMIGAGIFVLPGNAIGRAGWFAVVSFLLGGGIALLTAPSASELGTAMPRSGGAYLYVNRALGPLFGSVAGWANWLGLAFASAFYMVGFGEYIRAILGLSETIAVGPVALPAVKAVAFLAVFTVVGALRADPANLPSRTGSGGSLPTTGLIFISYLGFVQITSVAEEIQEPGKNLPRAVIGSVLLVSVVYALVLIVMAAAVEQGFIAEQQLADQLRDGPGQDRGAGTQRGPPAIRDSLPGHRYHRRAHPVVYRSGQRRTARDARQRVAPAHLRVAQRRTDCLHRTHGDRDQRRAGRRRSPVVLRGRPLANRGDGRTLGVHPLTARPDARRRGFGGDQRQARRRRLPRDGAAGQPRTRGGLPRGSRPGTERRRDVRCGGRDSHHRLPPRVRSWPHRRAHAGWSRVGLRRRDRGAAA